MAKKLISLIVLLAVFSVFCLPAYAGNLSDAWTNAKTAADSAGYSTSNTSIDSVVALVINIALSILGVIFVGLMVYGGFLWMTDRGNEDQVKRARNLISAAIIGLIIVASAYAISIFVLTRITEKTLAK